MGCQSSKNYVSFNITLCTEFFTLPEVEVTIQENVTVKSVEEQVLQYVQDKFNKSHFKVQLMWKEIKLKSNAYLSDYHFPFKCSLNSQVEYMGELLTLKMLINGNETKIKMLQNCNIGSLYTTAESFIKCDFKIYYKENELEHMYTLSNYGIIDDSELKVISADQFTSKLRWNSKRTGLILKGICQNPNCQAFQQKVLSNFGYGIFNISKLKHQLDCPVCMEKAKFLAFGFHNCKYLISEDVLNCDGVYNFKVVKNTQWNKGDTDQQKILVEHLKLKYYQSFDQAEFSAQTRTQSRCTNESSCNSTASKHISHNQFNYTFLETDRLGKESVVSGK